MTHKYHNTHVVIPPYRWHPNEPMSTYKRTEVAHLTEGTEFIDANDHPNVVTGFTFHDSPGTVTVHTNLYPTGVFHRTTDLVWVQA